MHELSIVGALIDLCEENARKNKAKSVDEVYVHMGVLSGVEKELFSSCFETFKQGGVCKNAKLFIKVVPLHGVCKDCGFSGVLKENVFLCPKCHSKEFRLDGGEELFLQSLVMS